MLFRSNLVGVNERIIASINMTTGFTWNNPWSVTNPSTAHSELDYDVSHSGAHQKYSDRFMSESIILTLKTLGTFVNLNNPNTSIPVI